MKRTKFYIGLLSSVAVLFLGMIVSACSDWDNHYDADSRINSEAAQTLWKNITANSDLSEFAGIIEQTDFAGRLDTTQIYTVWAPLNGTFDYETLSQETTKDLLKEFVRHHIARYLYNASGDINEEVTMLNTKMNKFSGTDGSYTFGGVDVVTADMPALNGMIHTLNGKVPFHANIYEYLDERDYAIDSLAAYIHGFDKITFDESNSLEGPTVDGQITYLDSVFIESNSLLWYVVNGNSYSTGLGDLHAEDSSYTLLIPTNEAWDAAYEKVESYYNYLDAFYFTDPINSDNTEYVSQDAAYLTDSMTHLSIVKDLTFNNNLYDNKYLIPAYDADNIIADSIVSVWEQSLSVSGGNAMYTAKQAMYTEDAQDLFSGATKIEVSNGAVWVTDTFRMKPWNSWAPIITTECENSTYIAGTVSGTAEAMRVTSLTQNPQVTGSVSGSGYIDILPTSSSSQPEVDIFIPNVLSTTYDIYGVFVPANITNTAVADSTLRPNYVRVTVGYANERGRTSTKTLGSFSNDVTKIDTVFFGELSFPIAYKATGDYYPYLRIKSNFKSNTQSGIYDNELRIDCILFVPKELDDYISEHPGYKVYREQ